MLIKRQFYLFLVIGLLLSNISSASSSNLLIMGDSLSAAYNLRPESGWVSLLENKLSASHPDIAVVNASVSGETTQGGQSRFKQLIDKYQPKWVVLELGANDALRGYPLTQTTGNLESMVELAQQSGAEVLLIGNQIPLNYGKRYTDMFYRLYQDIAEKYQLAYVPFMLKGVALDKKLMQADGLHPNEQGQLLVLENILPYLQGLLGEAQ